MRRVCGPFTYRDWSELAHTPPLYSSVWIKYEVRCLNGNSPEESRPGVCVRMSMPTCAIEGLCGSRHTGHKALSNFFFLLTRNDTDAGSSGGGSLEVHPYRSVTWPNHWVWIHRKVSKNKKMLFFFLHFICSWSCRAGCRYLQHSPQLICS